MSWESRHNLEQASNQKLAALVRQQRKGGDYACEYGHFGCGCTNAANMDGLAPCLDEVLHVAESRGLEL